MIVAAISSLSVCLMQLYLPANMSTTCSSFSCLVISFRDFFCKDLGLVTISFVKFFKIASGENAKLDCPAFSFLGVC